MTDPMLIWGLGLLGAAVLLVIVEIFLPSGGIIGVTAGIVAIGGVVQLFRYDTTWGMIGGVSVVVMTPVVIGLGLKIWPNTPVGRLMIHGTLKPESAEEKERKVQVERDADLALIGLEGRALTDLHPSGMVRIEGERMDAVADGVWVDKGCGVRVIGVEFNAVKVRPIDG